VEITMTPRTLKTLLLSLQQTVESYEQTFGRIELEKAFYPNLDVIKQAFDGMKKTIEASQAGEPS
jgi:hypothetical protein